MARYQQRQAEARRQRIWQRIVDEHPDLGHGGKLGEQPPAAPGYTVSEYGVTEQFPATERTWPSWATNLVRLAALVLAGAALVTFVAALVAELLYTLAT